MNEWIDFEIWMDEVQIVGYMGDVAQELQFISWDGFECYDDFERTNAIGETAESESEVMYLLKWCLIKDFLSKVDIRPTLLENMDRTATITYGAEDFRITLYINHSPLDKYNEILDDLD